VTQPLFVLADLDEFEVGLAALQRLAQFRWIRKIELEAELREKVVEDLLARHGEFLGLYFRVVGPVAADSARDTKGAKTILVVQVFGTSQIQLDITPLRRRGGEESLCSLYPPDTLQLSHSNFLLKKINVLTPTIRGA